MSVHKWKETGNGYDKEDQWDNFEMRYNYAKKVISDMYLSNDQKILFEKLEECKTVNDIDRVLAYGRTNLL